MTKLFQFILIVILINSCSLNTNSKFWTNSEKIVKDENLLETCIYLLNDKKRLKYMGLMSKNKFLKLSSKDPIKVWQKLF